MTHLSRLIRRFSSDERGVFAIMFGVLAVILIASSGAVVDFVGLQNARNVAQVALDSATLALHSEISNKTETQISDMAKDLLNERLSPLGLTAVVDTVSVDTNEGSLFIQARFSAPTSFLGLLGIPRISSRIHSQVSSKSSSLEVALVLDSTGSMGGRKMRTLKSAAQSLVSTLMPDPVNPDVAIALVPFNRYVNIGMSNRNEPGLDIEADYSYTPSGQSCRNTYPNDTRHCDTRRETYVTHPTICDYRNQTYTYYVDGSPRTGTRRVAYNCRPGPAQTRTRTVRYNCTGSRGAPVRVCTGRSPRRYRWFGCMGSRHLVPYDTVDDHYASNPVPGVVRRRRTCRVQPMVELTHTRRGLQQAISRMRAQDSTYIPTGLMWGWRLLSPQRPFAAKPYDAKNKKVLILMTDGKNTVSPSLTWTPHDQGQHRVHRGHNTSEANRKTAEICSNIADKDIVVYTIAFEVSDPTIRTILQNCAANGGSYFDANNSAALQEAFDDIAAELQTLRLTQ